MCILCANLNASLELQTVIDCLPKSFHKLHVCTPGQELCNYHQKLGQYICTDALITRKTKVQAVMGVQSAEHRKRVCVLTAIANNSLDF